jgi:hypothetical protein
MPMIPRVVEVKPLPQSCLWLHFHDGLEGSVDLSSELWGPMFEPQLAHHRRNSIVFAARAKS